MMQPESPLSEREIIRQNLLERVQSITPDQLRTQEKQLKVIDTVEGTLRTIAAAVKETAETEGRSRREVGLEWPFTFSDVAKSALTPPLPLAEADYQEGEAIPLEALVTDEEPWWWRLTPDQKHAIADTITNAFGLHMIAAESFSPPEGEEDETHIIEISSHPILLEDDQTQNLYPAITWKYEPVFTTLPKEE